MNTITLGGQVYTLMQGWWYDAQSRQVSGFMHFVLERQRADMGLKNAVVENAEHTDRVSVYDAAGCLIGYSGGLSNRDPNSPTRRPHKALRVREGAARFTAAYMRPTTR